MAEEISISYGGYSRLANILIGRDWLLFTLVSALLIATRSWKVALRDHAA